MSSAIDPEILLMLENTQRAAAVARAEAAERELAAVPVEAIRFYHTPYGELSREGSLRQANTEAWLAELATWKQRAEAAERELDDLHVMLSCLPEYMRYCNDIEGPTLTLAEWWSAQPDEVQP